MLDNKKNHFILQTKQLLFCPYVKPMIPTYHEWMQNPDLLYLTGSEQLTLEEEIQNQQSWLEDKSKCTFIILEKKKQTHLNTFEHLSQQQIGIAALEQAEMVGDVNLFFHPYLEENEAEIDIMIGEPSKRQKGYQPVLHFNRLRLGGCLNDDEICPLNLQQTIICCQNKAEQHTIDKTIRKAWIPVSEKGRLFSRSSLHDKLY